MKTYSAEELAEIIEKHGKWLREEGGGERANLSSADLSSANLRSADLRSANLRSADLRSADLSSANLSYANLSSANLSSADLSSANLSYANLSSADLSSANLSYANLSYANLRSANLSYANLSSADLSSANLRSADLRSADLSSANLSYADLSYADLSYADLSYATIQAFYHCPEVGEFTAFKKLSGGVIATLIIPADAKRVSSLVGRKCRAEFVKVIGLSGDVEEAVSMHNSSFVYRVGEIVRPDSFDEDIRVECTNGIHFFITRKEAEEYC